MAAATTTTKKTTIGSLPKEVFGVDVPKNHELLKLAYDAYLANSRANLAQTLKRGEVRGGGRKPWRQKGTGRARVGSSRSPLWRSGGITFGPSGNETYTKHINKQAKHVALRQALTLAATADKIIITPDFSADGKTKGAVEKLAKLGANGRILLVVTEKTPELIRATRNLQDVELKSALYLSVFHILNADKIVMTKDALQAVQTWLGGAQ